MKRSKNRSGQFKMCGNWGESKRLNAKRYRRIVSPLTRHGVTDWMSSKILEDSFLAIQNSLKIPSLEASKGFFLRNDGMKDVKDTKDTNNMCEMCDMKDMRNTKDMRDMKDMKDMRDVKDMRNM
jgi:hypothetical protein